jgi:hypothetical protein
VELVRNGRALALAPNGRLAAVEAKLTPIVTLGVDVGQRIDPTAVAVAQEEKRPGVKDDEVHYLIRHLERLPLGTSYPDVAKRLVAIVEGVHQQLEYTAVQAAYTPPRLYIDATGVGTPVVDTLRAAGIRAKVVAVYFTHGDRRTNQGSQITLGKAWLVSRLQALLQSGRLHLPKTREAEVLAKELLDYEIHVDEKANDTYGAFKVGTHDDLVTAVGLATQAERRLLQVT